MTTDTQAGWYDDGFGAMRWWDGKHWTEQVQPPAPPAGGLAGAINMTGAEAVAGGHLRPAPAAMSYVVIQVILKEKLWGTGSGNLPELEKTINAQATLGYRLHTISTAVSGSRGLGGGDRIQATMVFERLP
ncbi:hypothetical protein CVV68_03240 [Arthrobacter livingstonensis]|uniref:DUF2510 domain-containing protein n=1 Tax=Arthrobacter livingstonensis TaxID=670078 RepID=A0A2V5LEN5_9MICC|nr:DUF2510 domain-containing protein [Arthrobacter livingstonensis]PYI69422.1 hypothetical protein CVV68_03240 [Arthrobacter livingstonensis]